MDPIKDNAPVIMKRRDLDDLPAYALRDGFCLRWFRAGDDVLWPEIQLGAYQDEKVVPPGLFEREFVGDPATQAERICFLVERSTGEAIGTAAAWWQRDDDGVTWWRLHWVGIRHDHQGRGLAKPMVSEVCRRLRNLGHDRAFLTSSTARIPAINLYRVFGFEPVVRSAEDWLAWDCLRQHMKLGLGTDFPKECPTSRGKGGRA